MIDEKIRDSVVTSADNQEVHNCTDADSQDLRVSSQGDNSEQEMEEWKLRKNMENCAAFMARMLMKYGKDVLAEVDDGTGIVEPVSVPGVM